MKALCHLTQQAAFEDEKRVLVRFDIVTVARNFGAFLWAYILVIMGVGVHIIGEERLSIKLITTDLLIRHER